MLDNEFSCDPHLRSSNGRSLLHDACKGGNVTLVQTLVLEHEADISSRDDGNNTPISIAALYGKLNVVLCLIDVFGCDPNTRGSNGRSLLHNACEAGKVSLVKTLIREHKANISTRDYKNNTPLGIATLHGNMDVALCLTREM